MSKKRLTFQILMIHDKHFLSLPKKAMNFYENFLTHSLQHESLVIYNLHSDDACEKHSIHR